MDFRILGPLDVIDDAGSPVALGGPKQRALLALLLLDANTVVSSERLFYELWGDEPPGSGLSALHVRVSQLRRTLERLDQTSGESIVETRPPGYLLAIEDTQLDARRFEQLLAQASDTLENGDPATAVTRLDEALAMCRGAPLTGLAATPSIQAEAVRLEEMRLAAVQSRIEARLELGQHAALIPDLEHLVAQHPSRERLRAQLMRALYRSGRQADALTVFREGRRLLVETLGIEPCEELRQLEAAILRQDVSLALTRAHTAPSAPEPTGPQSRPEPETERKIVTILLADLAPTAGLEDLDAEQAAEDLDDWFAAAAVELNAAGGTVDSTRGDTIMAIFGAPLAHEDHAERALRAALGIRRRVTEVMCDDSLRVGVATGEVIAGRSGPGRPLVVGALVNVGARIQQAAASGEILVHERTARGVRDTFEFGPPRGGPEYGCRPLVRALSLTRPRGIGGLERAFVGRESELGMLRASYRRVAAGRRSALVTIVGDAGVGKSALVRTFWEWLGARSPEPVRRMGGCRSYGLGMTYAPLGDLVREQFGLRATDSPQDVRERLTDQAILGLTLGIEINPGLHALAARQRLQDALTALLEQVVEDRPAVLLIEDLHWAEAPLLELLERLLVDVAGPLLVIGTARPEFLTGGPAWTGLRDAVTVWLEPLEQADTELLLDELVGDALPGVLRQRLVARCEGNPFFVEELLADLVDRGAVVKTASGWRVEQQTSDLRISDSIQSVLAARIDLLPPDAKRALQAASVIGRTFWDGAVAELTPGNPPDVAALERRDFVRRRHSSTIDGVHEFVFKHALIRDVAYATLPIARRAQLHANFARWLERVGGGRDEHASQLAHHYSAQGVAEADQLRAKALEWLRRASRLAIGRFEIDDGIALLERAIGLEHGASAQCDLWHAVGRAKAIKYDAVGMWAAMETAMELADDDAVRADLCSEVAVQTLFRAGMLTSSSQEDSAQTWTRRALELAQPGTAARALALTAAVYCRLPDAMVGAAEAATIAEELDDPTVRYFAWDACAAAASDAGDYETAWAWLMRRLELLHQISDPDMTADIASTITNACIATGRIEQAREMAGWHDEITQRLTPHHRVHGVALLVELAEALGDWPAICLLEERVRDAVAANLATPCLRNARTLLVCAVARQALGQPEHAQRLEQAVEQIGAPRNARVDTPRLRLAMLRQDDKTVEQLLIRNLDPDRAYQIGYINTMVTTATRLDALENTMMTTATHLDALEALGMHDRLAAEAEPLLIPGTYLEPFATRALGYARADPALIERAMEQFRYLGLDWHASQTHLAHQDRQRNA